MKEVLILKGLPASGKTTYAKALLAAQPGKWKRVNKDDLRSLLDDGKWSRANEEVILKARDALILLALEQGYHVVCDDTNLHDKHRQRITELVRGKARVVVNSEFCDVPLEECIKRDLTRLNSVGEAVIRKMYNQYLAPTPPVIAHDPALPNAIICDLDGTLCLFGDANPYDRDFLEDKVNVPVRMVLNGLTTDGTDILFTSGRSERFRQQTEDWLRQKGFVPTHLFMRAEGDTRKDCIVKEEMYRQHIEGKYNVLLCLDDRDQVVSLWRSLGLTCFQVNYGAF